MKITSMAARLVCQTYFPLRCSPKSTSDPLQWTIDIFSWGPGLTSDQSERAATRVKLSITHVRDVAGVPIAKDGRRSSHLGAYQYSGFSAPDTQRLSLSMRGGQKALESYLMPHNAARSNYFHVTAYRYQRS